MSDLQRKGISRKKKRALIQALQKVRAASKRGRQLNPQKMEDFSEDFSKDLSEDFSTPEEGAKELVDVELLEGFINIGKEKIRQVIHS